ncbi:MAG: hypothetical protein GXO36_03945 [Chloroflexi bacterium]|nr:hypothetical protein [Chloroflexota bacterium]
MRASSSWWFGEEPLQPGAPSLWRLILRWALDRASHVEFTWPARRAAPATLHPFAAALERQVTSRWRYAAPIPLRGRVTYGRYRLTPELQAWLLRPSSLYAWMDDRPEDPALYRGPQLLVWTISHEGYVSARLPPNEAARVRDLGFALEPCPECPEVLYPEVGTPPHDSA